MVWLMSTLHSPAHRYLRWWTFNQVDRKVQNQPSPGIRDKAQLVSGAIGFFSCWRTLVTYETICDRCQSIPLTPHSSILHHIIVHVMSNLSKYVPSDVKEPEFTSTATDLEPMYDFKRVVLRSKVWLGAICFDHSGGIVLWNQIDVEQAWSSQWASSCTPVHLSCLSDECSVIRSSRNRPTHGLGGLGFLTFWLWYIDLHIIYRLPMGSVHSQSVISAWVSPVGTHPLRMGKVRYA